MVDIQSVTAEIRRGIKKKIEERNHRAKNIMSASATQGGHKNDMLRRNGPVMEESDVSLTNIPHSLPHIMAGKQLA